MNRSRLACEPPHDAREFLDILVAEFRE